MSLLPRLQERATRPAGFVRRVVRGTGGDTGRHAVGERSWLDLPVLALLLATLTWLVTVIRQGACLPGSAEVFANLCYTDITNTYATSGLAEGQVPYLGATLDQPVLTGALIEFVRELAVLLGAPVGAAEPELSQGSAIFFGVSAVVLFLCFLLVVFATLRAQRRGWDAVMVAVSPVVVMTGLINWDLFAVALAVAGLWAWAAKRPIAAGVLLGLATGARIYPGFLLIALLIVCIRGRRVSEWLNAAGGFLLAWAAVNLPLIIAAPDAWLASWTQNTTLGSVWAALEQSGRTLPEVDVLSTVLFAGAVVLIALIAWTTWRRPRVAQVAYLIMWALFVTNQDYRPQYGLILAVLMVWARPNWRDWAIFGVGQVYYVIAVWIYLDGSLYAADGQSSPAYQLAILFRITTEVWVAAMIIRDMYRPGHDPVRVGGVDDPGAGVLAGTRDAAWVQRLRARTVPLPVLWGRLWDGDAKPGTPPLAPLGVPGRGVHAMRVVLPAWLLGRGSLIIALVVTMAITGQSLWTSVWHWDTERFFTIAQYGYEPLDMTYRAFYPGWPIVLAIGNSVGIPLDIWGVLIATLCSLIAALALTRMGGRWAAVGWIFAPTAVFTMMPYSESLFCAFAFWAWQRARADKWWQAAVLAGLACTVRVSGLFLLFGLVIMVLTWSGIDWRGRLRRGLWLGVTAIMLGAYTVYLYLLTGSWSAWSEAQQKGWPREFTMPWTSILNTLRVVDPGGSYVDQPYLMVVFAFEFLSFVAGVVVVGWCLRRRLWAEAGYMAIQLVAFSTSYWLQSVNRAILVWFPLWIMLAHLALDRPATARGVVLQRVFRIGWAVVSPALMILWAWMYYSGQWAS